MSDTTPALRVALAASVRDDAGAELVIEAERLGVSSVWIAEAPMP
jgi:hypothetical protein